MPNLHALQLISEPNPQVNLQQIETLLSQMDFCDQSVVVLPECFACFGSSDKAQLQIAESFGTGEIQQQLSQLAAKYRIWLVAGTLPIKADEPDKFSATCLVYNPQGEVVANYQKMHLFDVQVSDNTGTYLESRYTQPGEQICVVDLPFARMGVAVCYDIRFPGLFQAMGEVDLLVLPAAFTEKTGRAHWHALLAARAIENQCYVIAANQGGEHANGRQTFGHSSIFSPWGEQLVKFDYGMGIISSPFDQALLSRIRQQMPVRQHNLFRSSFVKSR